MRRGVETTAPSAATLIYRPHMLVNNIGDRTPVRRESPGAGLAHVPRPAGARACGHHRSDSPSGRIAVLPGG